MKILFYSDQFCAHTATFIFNDVKNIAASHEVEYLCINRTNEDRFPFEPVHIAPFPTIPGLRKLYFELEKRGKYLNFSNGAFRATFHKVLRDFQPDIIQVNFGYEALRITDNLPRNFSTPIVINFLGHDASFHLKRTSYVKKLQALAQQPWAYATCNAIFLREQLEAKGIFFQENRIIHSGVDVPFFQRDPQVPQHDTFTFLQIASFQPRKGQDIAIRALKLLNNWEPQRDFHLTLVGGAVGDSYTPTEMQSLAKELGVDHRVSFVGWVTREEARELMLQSHCFIQHSLTVDGQTEGIPVAISEAMALEIPIVSTRHAGIPELVEEHTNGLLVDEGDIEGFANCMREMLDWKLKPQNQAKIESDFNIHNRASSFEAYYRSILA